MAILNYTTQVSTERTAGEIQRKLAMAGASAVMSEYDEDGIMSAMSFRISTRMGELHFRLPINIDGVYDVIQGERKVPKRLKTYDQASRIAWRIVKDWIEAQIAIIEAGQAELQEVFLPYAQNSRGETVYQRLVATEFKMLNE